MLPHDETGVTGTGEEATRGEVAFSTDPSQGTWPGCGLSLLRPTLLV